MVSSNSFITSITASGTGSWWSFPARVRSRRIRSIARLRAVVTSHAPGLARHARCGPALRRDRERLLRGILDRNRGGAYLTMLIFGSALFGIFLFLIYYMQVNLGYSAVKSGVALLPMVAVIGVMANVGNIKLMPRLGLEPLISLGLLCNAAGMSG